MIECDERRAFTSTRIVTIIGPGAAGKSSLGLALAPMTERVLIDLDQAFNDKIGNISDFILSQGYQQYKQRNSELAQELVMISARPLLLVTSSGFLTQDNPETALQANIKLVDASYSVCLLPSRNADQSAEIIVQRQMTRPFASTRKKEEARIRDRYPIYERAGDLVVFSTAFPNEIAAALAARLLI